MSDAAMPSSDQRTRYRVTGMDCAGCATKIEHAIRRLPGVSEVGVSVSAGTMTVAHGRDLSADASGMPR